MSTQAPYYSCIVIDEVEVSWQLVVPTCQWKCFMCHSVTACNKPVLLCRVDSLELMLAGISPRFSIPKASDAAFSTALDEAPSHSPYSLPAASSDSPSASTPSVSIPSGRSVEGANTSTEQQDDMPR